MEASGPPVRKGFISVAFDSDPAVLFAVASVSHACSRNRNFQACLQDLGCFSGRDVTRDDSIVCKGFVRAHLRHPPGRNAVSKQDTPKLLTSNLPLGCAFISPGLTSPAVGTVESSIVSGPSSPDFQLAALLSSEGEAMEIQREVT